MRDGKLLVALALMALTAFVGAQSKTAAPFDFAQGKPEYVRLFAPKGAHTGAYRAYVSPLDLQDVLTQLEGEPSLLRPPGAWTPVGLLPSDAFGQTGSYDRWKMAKLYGSSRVMVARGPRGDGERPREAWTLISPYPAPSLDRLEPGTLLIVLDLQTP